MGKTDNTINENRTMLAPNHLTKDMITHRERECPRSKSTRELKYSGAKVPRNESSSVLLELSFLGANSFGSEKAVIRRVGTLKTVLPLTASDKLFGVIEHCISLALQASGTSTSTVTSSSVCHHRPHGVVQAIMPLLSSKSDICATDYYLFTFAVCLP